MTSVPFSRSLVDAAGLTSGGDLDFTSMVRILRAIDARLMPLENQSGSLDAAIAAVRKVGLDRINEVLVPAIQLVFKIQSMGFLVARSGSSVTLADGEVLTLIVDEEQGRALFTPGPFIALTREANAEDYAIARTVDYDQTSGVLICQVLSFEGAAGPHSDWVIGALAGSTIAGQTILDQTIDEAEDYIDEAQELLGQTIGARDAAFGYRNDAAAEKGLAVEARGAAQGFATTAVGARDVALSYRDQAAASAAVATAAAGSVIDILDRVDILASLVWDLTDPNGAPFKGNFTRATGGGYRRNEKGVWVPTGNNEPVIDFGSDGRAKGTGFYGAYTNILLNSAALSTQTVSVSALTYTLSFRGTGSVTLSGAATGVLAGVEANNRVSLTFAASVGTLTVTVAGSVVEASLTATAFPVPYVPTTSAAVTRNADTMVISGADFTDFFNPAEGAIFADFTNPEVGTAAFPYPILISDGTGNNRIGFVQVNATGALTAVSRVGGVNVGSISFTSANGASIRAAFSYKADDFKAAVNGVTGADASGALPSGLDRLSFNEAFTSFRRVIYWPKALSATDLQRITA